MKAVKRTVCLVAALVMVMSLVACGDSGIVGTWSVAQDGIEVTYTFNSDGTGSMTVLGIPVDMKYTTSGDTLKITVSFFGQEDTQEMTYKVDGNKLTLTDDGESVVLTKK